MHTLKALIAAQQGSPTFEAILHGNDWAQHIGLERARRKNPAMFERIELQLAFIRSLTDDQLEALYHGPNPRLDWVAREIVNEKEAA